MMAGSPTKSVSTGIDSLRLCSYGHGELAVEWEVFVLYELCASDSVARTGKRIFLETNMEPNPRRKEAKRCTTRPEEPVHW